MKKVLLLQLLFISFSAAAQISGLDSLLRELPKPREDKEKVTLLLSLAQVTGGYKPDLTIMYARQALNLSEKLQYTYGIAEAYRILGHRLFFKGNQKSMVYLDSARHLFHKLNDLKGLEMMYFSLGVVYANAMLENGQLGIDSSNYWYNKSLSYAQQSKDSGMLAETYQQLALNYARKDENDKGEKYHELAQSLFRFSRVGDWEEAKRLSAIDFENTKRTVAAQKARKKAEDELINEKVAAAKKEQQLLVKDKELQLERQQRQIDRLARDKTQADFRFEQSNRVEKEKQLTIAQQEKALQASELALKESQLQLKNKELLAKSLQRDIIIVATIAFLLIAGGVYKNIKNKLKTNAIIAAEKLKTQKADTTRQLAEFEMHGLRAQLNPHFMFNSLNAIQEQILKEQNDAASTYLMRFAKMLRILLENADRQFITLEKEISFLKLYLAMEKLRLPELEYEITVDNAIDPEVVYVPNMILQPYLENSIWHGLSPKDGDKNIWIRIMQKHRGTLIVLEDNGIGRKRSAELKSQYRKAHNSKGMELLKKRFELIQREYGSEIGISFVDVVNDVGGTGTRVEILIPASVTLQKHLAEEAMVTG